MVKQTEMGHNDEEPIMSDMPEETNEQRENTTNLQNDTENSSDFSSLSDNVAENQNSEDGGENEPKELTIEEKYAMLNDSHLRLMAEFDNYRKRTLREKSDLIKSGAMSAMANLLPVIDDFERALGTLEKTDDIKPAIEGVKLIYNKFVSYLLQQGVKSMEAIGQPFDTELFEAIAMIPAPTPEQKGKVIDCTQTGYMLYDKVLRHAKVVVGE